MNKLSSQSAYTTHLESDESIVPLRTLLDLDRGYSNRNNDLLELLYGYVSVQVVDPDLVDLRSKVLVSSLSRGCSESVVYL